MTERTSVASFRRITPAIAASARLAMANDVPDTTKTEIALLLKRAAPVFGIDGTTYHVLDILLGLSRASDWTGSGRPIVAISNAKLAEYTMRSERTVSRCIRRLVEAGIAAYRDSSTGRRFVYRDAGGEIQNGFGIDFTPARVRIEELKHAVEAYQARLNAELAARRDVARLSRAIEDLCKAFPQSGEQMRGALTEITTSREDIMGRAERIRDLHERFLSECSVDEFDEGMSGEGDMHVTPYINTTPKSLPESRIKRTCSDEQENNLTDDRKAVEMAFEKKPKQAGQPAQPTAGPISSLNTPLLQDAILASVSIGLIQAGCAESQALISARFDSWATLGRSGETLRRMIGLSEAGWIDGRDKVGLYAASAILAVVVEKSIRDPEQISKPGGYFRAMIDRALEGRLNLERSLFGLAEARSS